jgi:hydroxymethylbilane synthase
MTVSVFDFDEESFLASGALRLGTRASILARWQADWVAARLRELGQAVEIVLVSTRGDRDQSRSIGAIGGDGLFTKELQRSLLADEIDLAVHSLKDLPTERVDGLAIGAVPARGPIGDVLVARDVKSFSELLQGAVIGTGSQRRRAQLLHARPELVMKDVRGNVETRLRKLHAGEYDALVLAEAGLTRLELRHEITELLPSSLMLPAIGQGALGIECRADDRRTHEAIRPLDDSDTHGAVTAERSLLRTLSGGCLAPVAGWGRTEGNGRLRLSAAVLSVDGRERLFAEQTATASAAEELGQSVAAELAAQGAHELIRAARDS